AVREGLDEALARADPELCEHLAQVPLDRARADEELRADLGVGHAVAGQARDVLLLMGELVARVVAATADLLAGGEELVAGARRPNASAPIDTNASCAARSCSRASTRRPARRSHSP